MKSYCSFESVPDNGIIAFAEGPVIRIWFDIAPFEIPASTDAPDAVHSESTHPQYISEHVDVHGRSYSDIVAAIVNDRYSSDDVQALFANRADALDPESGLEDGKRREYLAEYAAFQSWRAKAKAVARAVADSLGASS